MHKPAAGVGDCEEIDTKTAAQVLLLYVQSKVLSPTESKPRSIVFYIIFANQRFKHDAYK